jgi:short-subunit dehydrogenase
VAERLRERGLTVVGISRSEGEIRADLRRPKEIRRAFAEARERFGPADVLVNNAGIGSYKPLLEWSEEEIAATVELNLTLLMLCTQAALPDILERGHGLDQPAHAVVDELIVHPLRQSEY